MPPRKGSKKETPKKKAKLAKNEVEEEEEVDNVEEVEEKIEVKTPPVKKTRGRASAASKSKVLEKSPEKKEEEEKKEVVEEKKVEKVIEDKPIPTKKTKSTGNSNTKEKRQSTGETQTPLPKKQKISALTVNDILGDELTQLSLKYWVDSEEGIQPYNPQIVEDIYNNELKKFELKRIMVLDISKYLENYLWKNFDSKKSTFAHIMSIIILINEKFREGLSAWDSLRVRNDIFPSFFDRILGLRSQPLTIQEKTTYILFLINCFQSLEESMVRSECMRLVSLPSWHSLNPERLKKELKVAPKVAKRWNALLNEEQKSGRDLINEKTFMMKLITDFFTILDSLSNVDENNTSTLGKPELLSIRYCERFLEFMIDLISQIPTRRFFHPLMQDSHLIVQCRLSKLAKLEPAGKLFSQLLEMLRFFEGFEIDPLSGSAMTDDEVGAKHSSKLQNLQKIAFAHFPELRKLALANISSLSTSTGITKYLTNLNDQRLRELAVQNSLIGPLAGKVIQGQSVESREMLKEIIIEAFETRVSQVESINNMPCYPTEGLLWDPDIIPSDEYDGEQTLALPKLNLQFLSIYDYLLRNYDLFRLESSYEIKADIETAVRKVQAVRSSEKGGQTVFNGWSRYSLPIDGFSVNHVGPPRLGEKRPSEVLADVKFNIKQFNGVIRQEWETIKQYDVLFLLTIRPTIFAGDQIDTSVPFKQQFGVTYVRGCEVRELLDEEGNVIRDFENQISKKAGNVRTIKVKLDPSQYQRDLEQNDEEVYGTFNLLLRRKPKENNFKAVLETIRDIMNSSASVPDWLHDVFLGYGDTNNIRPKESLNEHTLDMIDTFVNAEHVAESFPGRTITFLDAQGKKADLKKNGNKLFPPFKLIFDKDQNSKNITVQSYIQPNQGPFPQDEPKRNKVPFTPAQIEAVVSGTNPGLTMVVGPPGTGKTDLAVQIISNLYHNFPQQRTLLVTHSNQALNQLFEKIIALDIDERHILRLGHGEELLETTKDFSKFGRVNHMLERRITMLERVDVLARTLGITEDVGSTCETAEYFLTSQILPRWEEFNTKMNSKTKPNVTDIFPFKKFFAAAPQPLFKGKFEEDMEIANGCWRHLNNMFDIIKETRAFELLKNPIERGNYLLTKQAKIIAMTCTHAALKRPDLIELGFKYDNLLMEEAAQILEIETFIPMILQEHSSNEQSRLKRIILIGDHNQLPPIVKNMAFQKFSHMDQSLFSRFVRLGVPTITLDAQDSDMDYQLIDVWNYEGSGESQPSTFFYQNVGEAEYVIAVFMYMRHTGVPVEKISILTTYNGQKALLRDVWQARCSWNKFYGKPKITTVDRFQGQQNDYVLLSLVRTKQVGHLRDKRRLVVAMSRARLGLYVFCRKALFENCYELTESFVHFLNRPSKLQLVQNETYPTTRKIEDNIKSFEVNDVIHMGELIHVMQQQLIEEQKKMVDNGKSKTSEGKKGDNDDNDVEMKEKTLKDS